MSQVLHISVDNIDVRTREVTSRTGERFVFRDQAVTAYLRSKSSPELKPRKCFVPLSREDEPYPPGAYELAVGSFYVDRKANDNLALFARLVPLEHQLEDCPI